MTNIATTFTGTLYAGMTAFSGDRTHRDRRVRHRDLRLPSNLPRREYRQSYSDDLTSSKSPMQIRQENDALPNAGYYWSDAWAAA